MKFVLVALLAVVSFARLLPAEEYAREWRQFLAQFKPHDGPVKQRFEAFCDNLDLIRTHNAQESSYELGVNQFSDLTFAEFSQRYLNPNARCSHQVGNLHSENAPDEKDWVEEGAVTPVKNQGQCGSCYAFSAISAVEGFLAIKHDVHTDISPQMVVDCSSKYGNQGCNGGFMDNVFKYIAQGAHGICAEKEYPYKGVAGKCHNCTIVEHTDEITGFRAVKSDSEEDLEEASAETVVSVAIEATSSFQSYKKGVYTGPCSTNLNHGVTLVGYGTDDSTGKKFWKVKNSWGGTWGEGGYIRMVKGASGPHGICGIATCASYPVDE